MQQASEFRLANADLIADYYHVMLAQNCQYVIIILFQSTAVTFSFAYLNFNPLSGNVPDAFSMYIFLL